MKKLFLLVLIALLCSFSMEVFALVEKHPFEMTQVEADGEAPADAQNAEELAVADALRNAVMKVVGVYVHSTEIGHNYEIIKNEVLLKTDGFATLDEVISSSRANGVLRVRIRASVSNRPVAERLKALGLTHDWKVGVYIPERFGDERRRESELAAEGAVVDQLMKLGFRVIDEAQRNKLINDALLGLAREGRYDALRSIKREYDVDIFITGDAFAEYVDQAEMGGVMLYRTRGRAELKAYYTDTGEVLSITDATADGLDQTEMLSAKQCLKKLGVKAGAVIAEDILIAPADMTPFVTVKINNFVKMTQVTEFEKTLLSLPGVSEVRRQRLTNGLLEVNVYIDSDFREELAERIEKSHLGKRLGISIDSWSKTIIEGRITRS